MYFRLRPLFKSFYFFFHLIYPFGLPFVFFLFSYFTPKLFCFLCIWFLVCSRAFLLVVFSFVILECPVLFELLDPVSVFFKSPFFLQSFDLSLQVKFPEFSAFWLSSFHPDISLHVYRSFELSLVFANSLPGLLV